MSIWGYDYYNEDEIKKINKNKFIKKDEIFIKWCIFLIIVGIVTRVIILNLG